jgi:hypothetical protein
MTSPWGDTADFSVTPAATQSNPWGDSASFESAVPQYQNGQTLGGSISAIPQERSLSDKAVRQMELAGRAGFEGLTELGQLPATAAIAIANGTRKAGDYVTGVDQLSPSVEYPSQYTGKMLDSIGMPRPEDGAERIEADVLKARGGAKALSENPLVTTSAQIGALSSGSAREGGYSPTTQFATGLLGGMVGGPLINSAKNMGLTAVQPFTNAGRQQLIANKFASLSDDPTGAAQKILNAPEYVQGSVPLAGTASSDTGLMAAQKGIQRFDPVAFSNRATQQTEAQNDQLGKIAGNPADLGKLLADRKTATEPLYEAATAFPVNPKELTPALRNIDDKIVKVGSDSDAGKALLNLKQKIISSLPSMKSVNSNILDQYGSPIASPVFKNVESGPIIQAYKEERDNLLKDSIIPNAYGSAVKGVIEPANKQLGLLLAKQNPALAQADNTFSKMSQPINQLQAGQEIKAQIQANSPNTAGQLPIAQPKLQQLMENGEVNVNGNPIPIKNLSLSQQSGLKNLQSDMNRNATINKAPSLPSSEFSDMATQGRIGQFMSHVPYVKGAVIGNQEKIQQGLANAMLNNPEMASLLQQGQIAKAQKLSQILLQSSTGSGIGNAISYGDSQ